MHAPLYVLWLIGQIFVATGVLIKDMLHGYKSMEPCVVYYPLRVTKEWQITALAASITITPGTMSIGLREDGTLLVHAVYGHNPADVLADIATMEEHLAPSVKDIPHKVANVRIEHPAHLAIRKEQ
ncbi:monovalent cation/H+ antiporter subunit E [Corynebacterium rouxii]|uniref:Cation:proton antiporter n=1 Tax=Corynebacterium rouxii TaxID=2719119 RepID=A0A6I8MG78_9CORY|nr:monovalent cation/H+ antiporter subunit E [Corynebacterium rouxii]MDT9407990.1 monovalent cation/H+ antiporter subunit E [Corynebacterium rouxii]MDT9410172.1 monovalent cation/H+ antiporter subunit E [Corynebacterium rouxii]VZH84257.1 cation:proton antiporter [Corynebacterium rouxii]